MRRFLLILSWFGTLVFGGVFVTSFVSPLLIEQGAREIVRIEVERRVGEKVDRLTETRLTGFAQRILRETDSDIAATRQAIRDEVPSRVVLFIASMLNPNCPCRSILVQRALEVENDHLLSLTAIRDRLTTFIESAYASVAQQLMRELRIFCGSNAVAFALLGLVTHLRRRAMLQLMMPAIVLVGAVSVTGSLYLFEQNWLHTIVFGDYAGFTYAIYLMTMALLLADIVFNRARLTTRMLDLSINAVGAVVAAPC